MPIVQERMIALLRAGETYQTKITDMGRFIKAVRAVVLPEQVKILKRANLTDDELGAIETILFQFERLEDLLNKPMDQEAILAFLTEKAHFNARAKANAASKRYMQKSRRLRENAANWERRNNKNYEEAVKTGEAVWFETCRDCATKSECINSEHCSIYKDLKESEEPTEITEEEFEYIPTNAPAPTFATIGKRKEQTSE